MYKTTNKQYLLMHIYYMSISKYACTHLSVHGHHDVRGGVLEHLQVLLDLLAVRPQLQQPVVKLPELVDQELVVLLDLYICIY